MQKKIHCFELVAHRGIANEAPENTLASFERAIELGADAVEMDVRLTSDKVPVIYHYFTLETNTSFSGAIFNYSWPQLRKADVFCKGDPATPIGHISTLEEVLNAIGGKVDLELHMQGPEPEAAEIIGKVLLGFRTLWNSMEVTCYEPALLHIFHEVCPGVPVDLLFPRSESWMTPEIVQYLALHHSRLAHARAVHLHPSQLSEGTIMRLRKEGIEIHAWDVNDIPSLEIVTDLEIPKVCTDDFKQAFAFRESLITRYKVQSRSN